MKNIKTIFLVLIMVVLIIVNIIFELTRDSFSNDANDNNITKTSNKYVKETDENKYQIIFDCFNRLITHVNSNNTDALNSVLEDTNLNDLSKMTDITIKEIYKYENESIGIYYVNTYTEKNSKLTEEYYKFTLDYTHNSYSITKTDKNNYDLAKLDKVSKELPASVEVNEYNEYSYNDESLNIAYRYINDCYLKSKYIPDEAKKVIVSGKMNTKTKISMDEIETFKKTINRSDITYNITTQTTEYEIIVYSIMDYKINIISQEE